MKNIIILTLFKTTIEIILNYSIIKRAIKKKIINIKIIDFRQYATNKHKKVDGRQIGGEPGMVISLPPVVKAIKKNKTKNMKIILLSNREKFTTKKKL